MGDDGENFWAMTMIFKRKVGLDICVKFTIYSEVILRYIARGYYGKTRLLRSWSKLCRLCSVQTVPAAQTAKFAQLVISERLKKC